MTQSHPRVRKTLAARGADGIPTERTAETRSHAAPARRNQPRHVLPHDIRPGEIAMNRALEVTRVLNVERAVEAHPAPNRSERLRICLGTWERNCGSSRHHKRNCKCDE